MSLPLLLPILDGAHQLGVGRTKLYELIASGDIKAVKVGTRRMVVSASLVAYIARLGAAGTTGETA